MLWDVPSITRIGIKYLFFLTLIVPIHRTGFKRWSFTGSPNRALAPRTPSPRGLCWRLLSASNNHTREPLLWTCRHSRRPSPHLLPLGTTFVSFWSQRGHPSRPYLHGKSRHESTQSPDGDSFPVSERTPSREIDSRKKTPCGVTDYLLAHGPELSPKTRPVTR